MVSEIFELKKVRDQISGLSIREAELSKPKLTDLSLITHIQSYFNELFGIGDTRKSGIRQRKKFVFIVMLFYSPSMLAGGRMSSGLRNELASLLRLNAPTAVSHICGDLLFAYQHYRDFRVDIDKAVLKIEDRLKEDGHIQ